jgi:tetratricopeptide (TPR) repeat protein
MENDLIEIHESGDLAEIPFPRVFSRFCREKRTGTLDILDKPAQQGGRVMKRVLMADGERFSVLGGRPNETLGQVLLEKGKLSAEQYESLKEEAKASDGKIDYGKIEQKILTGAVIPPAEIPDMLSFQAALKIKTLFATILGHYQLKVQPASDLNSKHVLVPVPVGKLIFEGAMDFYPLSRIKKEFADIDKKSFGPAPDAGERINGMGLPPNVMRWLRNLPESFNWKSMLMRAPGSKDQATVILLALYFAEIIVIPAKEDCFPVGSVYKEAPSDAMKKPAADAKKEDKPAAAKPESEPKVKEEPKLPIEEVLDKDMSDEEILAEIDRLLDLALKKDSTYFDILGVQEKTLPDKVKKVYFKYAKKFHPDAKPDLFRGEVKDKVEDLFTKVSEAYNTLADPELRADYIKMIKSRVSKEDMEMAQRAIEAEQELQKAEILLRKGSWAQAVEGLERAVKLQPDEPEYQMYLAWANYKSKGPGELSKSLKIIKQALDKRPKAADGYFFMGHLEKDSGNLNRAEEYFEKASTMKPHDVDIKRELQIIRRRRVKQATEPKKKGGLFGKKK